MQTVPGRVNPRRKTTKHIVIELIKIKEKKVFERTREKQQITYKGTTVRLSAHFLSGGSAQYI